MPDRDGNMRADEGTETPLHAYKDRPESVEGDPTGHEVAAKSEQNREDPDKH